MPLSLDYGGGGGNDEREREEEAGYDEVLVNRGRKR